MSAQPVDEGYPPDVTTEPEERLAYTVREVARRVGGSPNWVRELIAQGTLPSTKVGGRRLVLREDLIDLLRSGRTPRVADG